MAAVAAAGVNKAHPLEHRREKIQLLGEVAVRHFEAGVPVAEIRVEAHLGIAFGELHRAPGILGDGGTMGFNINRQLVAHRHPHGGVDQAVDLGIIFVTPADMQGHRLIAGLEPGLNHRFELFGLIHAAAARAAQADRLGEHRIFGAALNTTITCVLDRLQLGSRAVRLLGSLRPRG